jgi:hypothetical protein
MKWTDERTVDIGIYQNTSRLKDGRKKIGDNRRVLYDQVSIINDR